MKKYYAVRAGIKPGVYTSYTEAKKQIRGFKGSQWKGFNWEPEAQHYCRPKLTVSSRGISKPRNEPRSKTQIRAEAVAKAIEEEESAKEKAFVEAVSKAQLEVDLRTKELKEAKYTFNEVYAKEELSRARDERRRIVKERRDTKRMYFVTGNSVYDSEMEARKNYRGVIHGCRTLDEAIYSASGCGREEPQFRFTEEFSYVNNKNQTVYQVYTDGACSNNGQPDAKGAIGVCFGANHPKNASRPLAKWEPQTNQRAELAAILGAYEIIRYSEDKAEKLYEIHTDSAYALNAVTKWYKKWSENDWTHKDGEPVKHKDLIEDILELKEGPHCKKVLGLRKVKAHSDCEGNNIADELAKLGLIRVSYGDW